MPRGNQRLRGEPARAPRKCLYAAQGDGELVVEPPTFRFFSLAPVAAVALQQSWSGHRVTAQSLSLLQPPSVLVGGGEVIAGDQGVGVGFAQEPLVVGEGALVQRDGLLEPPGVLVGVGEVVAGGQGVGVGFAQEPLAIGEGALAIKIAMPLTCHYPRSPAVRNGYSRTADCAGQDD